MVTILADKNCEGQVSAIARAVAKMNLADLLPIHFIRFRDVGLAENATDEVVWIYCQSHEYLLITGNRRTVDGDDSLELVMQRLANEHSLPILTIENLNRVVLDAEYCEKCANTLINIIWRMEYHQEYRGTPRLYIPFNH